LFRSKQARVTIVCHVKHAKIAHRPNRLCDLAGTIPAYKHRKAPVNRCRNFSIAFCPKYRCGAGVGINQGKAVLFGAVERGGDIRVGVVDDTKMGTIKPTIALNVERGSKISTDDGRHYLNLSGMGYDHGAVNHSAYEWVRGDVHTNTIEDHWGLFRRAIKGTNVHISKKHLWKYASEFSYRRNLCGCHLTMFNRLVYGIALPRLVEP
jgi:transposase-like protein